jgi:hypothetical protein
MMLKKQDKQRGAEPDRGAAMILVMAWSMLLLLLALVVTRAAIGQILPSDHSEHSYAALAAAEAGIDDYRARLLAQPSYYGTVDPANLSLRGWATVPGGDTDSEFTIAVDSSRAGAGGEIRLYSTGRSGNVSRTVEALLSKRSTLDYVYMSDIETPSPMLPGAYSTAPIAGAVNGQPTSQAVASSLCSRYWYSAGYVTPTTQGNQRNLNFCQWAGIYDTENIVGKLHSNDVWRLENTNLSGALDAGAISSACRSTADGLLAGEVGCTALRRFLSTTESGITSNNGANAVWPPASNPTYQGDAFRPATTGDATQRNPRYEPVLELPQSPALLKKRASDSGCVFTGPTRIRFSVESGIGYMYVTSPDTMLTATGCGAATLKGSTATPAAQATKKIALAGFTDLVLYVQDVPRAGQADDPDNDYDVSNRWVAGTEPTCKVKSTKVFPYVIPNDTVDKALFNSGSTYKGFPAEQADPASPWYSNNCSSGDLYVQGSYKGNLTIATQSNIILTSSLMDSTASPTTGKPAVTSKSALGLVSEKFSYAYRPFKADHTWVGDWKSSNAVDPKYDFALLAVDECFAAQDPFYAPRQGNIYLWGSLAQKYRCVVGSTGGYNKQYSFDSRLMDLHPPYMLELSTEPWEVERLAELTMPTQSVGAKSWPMITAQDGTATVQGALVEFGSASVAVVGTTATVTATSSGVVVVLYEVVSGTSVETRHLVILVE